MTRIAAINDDPSYAALLGDLIEDRGGDVVTCCDGRSAYDVLRRDRPDLIVLDLGTKKPEGGWDLLTFLQIHPTLRNVPTIVCSGPTDEILAKEEWLESHGIRVLEKPFELDDLYRCLDTALRR